MEPISVLGLDVGGVLVDRVAEDSDTSFFGDHPMDTPRTDGSLEAVRELLELFEYRVHIISKAGPRISALTRQWLGEQGFTGAGAIPAGNLHFVRKRPEKASVCAELGVTHFVDDRLDVLGHLGAVRHRYLFTGGLGTNAPPGNVPRQFMLVRTWPDVLTRIRRTLAA